MPAVARTRTTAKRWPKFISAIAATGNVREAARTAGVDRVAAYRKRWREPEFAAKWEEAELLAVELLEDEARRRAHDGVDKPIYHQGKRVDVVKDYSDTLLIFLLKGAKPTKYRDNAAWQQLGADGKPVDPAGPVNIVLMTYASQAPATIEGAAEPAVIDAPLATER
jgi:hypothetical protein